MLKNQMWNGTEVKNQFHEPTSYDLHPSHDSYCSISHGCYSISVTYGFAFHNQWSFIVSVSLVLSQGACAGNQYWYSLCQ